MKKKRQSKRPLSTVTLTRTIKWIAGVTVVAVLAFSNWFVHLPSAQRATWCAAQVPLEMLGNVTADLTDRFGLTGRDITIALPDDWPADKTSFGLPAYQSRPAQKNLQILSRKGFVVGYAPAWKHPSWAMYHIERESFNPTIKERPRHFSEDLDLRSPSPRHGDYSRSGYDRGHCVPNFAMAAYHGRGAQLQTFLLSNIAPQRPDLNQGPWVEVEQRIANDLTKRYGALSIIVGAIPSKPTKRLKSGIEIPKGFYQIIYTVKDNILRVVALYMPQSITRDAPVRAYFVSIDKIEALSGLDFFPHLPQALQKELESQEGNRFWPTYELSRVKRY